MNYIVLAVIIISILLSIPLFFWGWQLIKKQQAKRLQMLKDFSRDLGLKAAASPMDHALPSAKKKSAFRPMGFEGEYFGRKASLLLTTKSAGQTQIPYVTLRFPVENPSELTMQLAPEFALSSIGKMFGMQDIEIGDSRIDEHYIIKSSDESFMRVAFIKEIIAHFHALMDTGAKGAVTLKKDCLQFEEAGGLKSGGMKEKMAAALVLLRDLSDVVSVYRK